MDAGSHSPLARWRHALVIACLALGAAACGGGGGAASVVASLSLISSSSQAEAGGGGVTLTAQNVAPSTTVTWSLPAGSTGRLDADTGSTVHYLPPAAGTLSDDATVSITASTGQMTRTISLKLRPSPGIYLVAGRIGGPGDLDGAVGEARFSGPASITSDRQGNLLVGEARFQRIRRISPEGIVTTLKVRGNADDFRVNSIAAGKDDTIYGASSYGVYKIAPDGTTSLLAGSPDTGGYADGVGADARFDNIAGMAIDNAGNLLVADCRINAIRKITPDGLVTTIAGTRGVAGNTDGPAGQALFNCPRAIAVDPSGNMFVADSFTERHPYYSTIRKITQDGNVSTLAGSSLLQSKIVDGTGTDAGFGNISAMATDMAGNIFITDIDYNTSHIALVRKVTPAGVVTTLAGSTSSDASRAYYEDYVDGVGASAKFRDPSGIAADTAGNLYVADTVNDVIRKVTQAGVVTTYAGASANGPIQGVGDGMGANAVFYGASSLRGDGAGNFFMISKGIRKIAAGGVVTSPINGLTSMTMYTGDIAIGADGSFYLGYGHQVIKISADGKFSVFAGIGCRANGFYGLSCEPGQKDGIGTAAVIGLPQGIVEDGKGTIYFLDHDWETGISALRKISSSAQVSTLTRLPVDWTEPTFESISLMALAMDPTGNFYVTDRSTVSKIAPDGKVTLIAGLSGQVGWQDGLGTAARFNYPSGIAVDADGALYVADTGNNAIRKIDPSGVVTTVVGGTGEGNRPGPLPGALRHPKGIAIASPKTLVVSAADCVLKIVLQQ